MAKNDWETNNPLFVKKPNLTANRERNYMPASPLSDAGIVDDFISTVDTFRKDNQADQSFMNYSNAGTVISTRSRQSQEIDQKIEGLRSWMSTNAGKFGKDYTDKLGSYLDTVASWNKDKKLWYQQQGDFFGRFGSQEEYDRNQYLSGMDISASQAEAERLQRDYDQWLRENQGQAFLVSNEGANVVNPMLRGEMDRRQSQISTLQRDIREAERIQEWADMESAPFQADFDQYSGYDQNNRGNVLYDYINNAPGTRERLAEAYRMQIPNGAPIQMRSGYQEKGYEQMTPKEVATFNYYFNKEGQEAAQSYLDSIQEDLAYREAVKLYTQMEGNTLLEYLHGVDIGLDNFNRGVHDVVDMLSGNESYAPATVKQITAQMIDENLKDTGPVILGRSLGQIGFDLITNTANMAPSILASSVIGLINPAAGAVVGNTLMGASAAGAGYQEMINAGYSREQASHYGTMVGASEAVLGALLGGITKLGGIGSEKLIQAALSNVDNALGRLAINLGGKAISEFSEEYLQEILEPVFRNMMLGENNEIRLVTPEAIYSGILGALTAGLLEGSTVGIETASTYNVGKRLQNAGVTNEQVRNLGQTFSADSQAYKIAGRVSKDTGAYTIGRLFNEIGAQMTEQNTRDISQKLQERGMPEELAQKNAEVVGRMLEGWEPTKAEAQLLESNEVLSDALIEFIGANSDIDSRINTYQQMIDQLAVKKEALRRGAQEAQQREQNREAETAVPVQTPAAQATEEALGDTVSRNSDGKPVTLGEVTEVRDGELIFRNGNETVSSKDVSFGDDNRGALVETISRLDVGTGGATRLITDYNSLPKDQQQSYIQGIQDAYRYGQMNIPQSQMTHNAQVAALPGYTQQYLYRRGQHNEGRKIARENARRRASGERQISPGRVHFDSQGKKLNNMQTTAIKTMEQLGRMLGIEFYVYESRTNEAGERVYTDRQGKEAAAPNGYYVSEKGDIHIDLNAGDKGTGAMLFAVAHELTHFIKEWSPGKYKILSNLLLESYAQRGINVDDLIDARMAAEKGLTREAALEEVVARSMETMLSDGTVVELLAEVKQRDKKLWQKIVDWFRDLAQDLKRLTAAYKGVRPDSIEGQMVQQMEEMQVIFQSLYTAALDEAGTNFQNAKGNKNTAQEGGRDKQYTRNNDLVDKYYERQIEKWDGKDHGGAFRVGGVSDPLIAVGIPNVDIWFDQSKAAKQIADKEEIDKTVLKKIPDVLANPIAISESYDNTVMVFGQLFDKFGNPIVVAVRINSTSRRNHITVVNKVRSVGSRSHNLDTILDDGTILWLNENKKETKAWFNALGRSTPFGGTKFGLIRKIAQKQPTVKKSSRNTFPIEEETVKAHEQDAISFFGRTYSWKETGYLTVSGKKLDFSGRHEGAGGGYRTVDHRDIRDAIGDDYGGTDYSGAMVAFMQEGNIRISPESGGINLLVEPTKAQYSALDDFISRERGEVILDIDDSNGNTVSSTEYPRGTRSSKIIADIKAYFETGVEPAVSLISQFHYSRRSEEGTAVGEAIDAQNAELTEDVALLRQLKKTMAAMKVGSEIHLSLSEAAGRTIMKEAGVSGNQKELGAILNQFFKEINSEGNLTLDRVAELARPAVRWLREHRKTERDGFAQEVLQQIRGSKVRLDDSQKGEAAHRFGSYNDLRKALFGTVTFSNDGISLDSQWHEWSGLYPSIFPEDTTASDMPGALYDVVQRLRNMEDVSSIGFLMNEQELTRLVYDGYWQAVATKISEEQRQGEINRLRSLHQRRMEKLQKTHKEQTARLEQQFREKIKAVREEGRKAREEQYQRLVEKSRQSRQNAAQGRRMTAQKAKIRRTIRDLRNLLEKGTKDRNVKEGMKDFVTKALKTADVLLTETYTDTDILYYGFTTTGDILTEQEQKWAQEAREILIQLRNLPGGNYDAYQQRQEMEKSLKAQLSYRTGKLRDAITRERARMNAMTVERVLNDLSNAYDSLRDSEDGYISGAYIEGVSTYLKSLQETLKGTRVRDLSLSQLEALERAYTMVLTTVRNANRMFNANLKESRVELGNATIREIIESGKRYRLGSGAGAQVTKYSWDNTKPIYAADRVGSKTFRKLMQGIFDGQYAWARDIEEATQFQAAQAEKYRVKDWDRRATAEFTSATGEKFTLDLGQMMSIYAYSRREAAFNHMTKGGFTFGRDSKGNKVQNATAYQLNQNIIGEIVNSLTTEQKGYVEDMQKYLSETMGGKGNEVSMKLFGIKLFGEENYFPIRSSGQYMERAREADLKKEQGQINLVNSGFTKAVTPHANNPMVLDGFMDVWAEHVNEMSTYHSMVLPMEDFRKVYNFATPNVEGQQSRSVNAALENAFSSAATSYFNQLYKELNSGTMVDPREGFFNKAVSLFKKGAVVGSMSVVVQQPSAIGRAFALVDPKYFVGRPRNIRKNWEQLKQYGSVAIIKDIGGFDTHAGLGVKDYLLGGNQRNILEKTDDLLGKAPAKADQITWLAIWDAVKRETRARNPEIKDEAYLKEAGRRFNEVIEYTQVYDSTLSRSSLMRGKTSYLQMLTAFMAEPTTTINMVENAIRSGDRKKILKTMGAVASSILINNVMASLVYAARDDDEDETWLEKYAQSLASGTVDDLNPLTYYPFIKDVWSLFQGYDVQRSDLSIVNTLKIAWDTVVKTQSKDTSGMTEEEKVQWNRELWNGYYGLVEAAAGLAGIPMKNLRRDIMALYNLGETAYLDITQRDTTRLSLRDAVHGQDKKKQDRLYDAILNGDEVYLERLRSTYSSAQSYRSAVKEAIQEHDPRIREAAEARYNGDMDAYAALKDQIISEGHFSQNDVIGAIEAEMNKLKPEEEKEEKEPDLKSAFHVSEVIDAIGRGDADAANLAANELIQTAVANGKTQEEAEEAFLNNMKDQIKAAFMARPDYKGSVLDKDKAVSALMEFCDMDREEAEEKVLDWGFYHEFGYHKSSALASVKDLYFGVEIKADGGPEDLSLSRRQAISALKKYCGMTQHEAEKKVADWDFGKKYGEYESSALNTARDMYIRSDMSRQEALNALTTYSGMDEYEAEREIKKWDYRISHGYFASEIGDLYKKGKLSRQEAIQALIDNGDDKEYAEAGVEAFEWQLDGYEDATAARVKDYNDFCREYNIAKDLYLHAMVEISRMYSDKDENGESIYGSKPKKIAAFIDTLPLTPAQKTALFKTYSDAARTIRRYKRW